MYIAWIKTNKPMEMYGNIPEVYKSDNATVIYGNTEQALKIYTYLLPQIDRVIQTELSYGDVDYFNSLQCLKILKILEKNKDSLLKNLGEKLYSVLVTACQEAARRETGIVIEL